MKQSDIIRKGFTFSGIVQGVGFRPTVYRCAVRLGLTGFVQNRRSVVVAEVQGDKKRVDSFRTVLLDELPDAAALESIEEEDIETVEETAFEIVASRTSDYVFPPIPPDLAMCDTCRLELLDPENRRYLYPFITCTQCGPRYSIVENTPFDRDTTSMIDFPQCPDCLKEYTDPLDRRFHSQTNSCARCGPELSLVNSLGEKIPGDPVRGAIEALKAGTIVAIQGIGGFHLAVDPSKPGAVTRLRESKERERKPFALMVKDIDEANRLCMVQDADIPILSSPESPIVILPVTQEAPTYIQEVSDIGTLGIMLPYTPLHYLLFFHPGVDIPYRHLIMTSGNLRDEPIVTAWSEAVKKLNGVADRFLYNNRRIIFRTDDSVLRSLGGVGSSLRTATSATADQPKKTGLPVVIRRSRGYVPRIIKLKQPLDKVTLAVGGDLKSAPAFGSGEDVYIAPYIGDLENADAFEAFTVQIDKILSLYEMTPERIVSDMHPGYHSSAWAAGWKDQERVQVQHHHAHILSVMAEHQLEKALGLSFDGTGYGTDGTIWGGEFLCATRDGCTRLGSFKPFYLPGAGGAVRHPRRTAYSLLSEVTDREHACRIAGISPQERELIPDMVKRGVNSPITSSLGRIFDAAAALLGIVDTVGYEGEGPMKLEGRAWKAYTEYASLEVSVLRRHMGMEHTVSDPIPLKRVIQSRDGHSSSAPSFLLNAAPLLYFLAERKGEHTVEVLSFLFHKEIVDAAVRGADTMKELTGVSEIALSGGVFQNSLLIRLMIPLLEERGFSVFTNRRVPPGDGGVSLGQLYFSG